jgi:hypothetical protein
VTSLASTCGLQTKRINTWSTHYCRNDPVSHVIARKRSKNIPNFTKESTNHHLFYMLHYLLTFSPSAPQLTSIQFSPIPPIHHARTKEKGDSGSSIHIIAYFFYVKLLVKVVITSFNLASRSLLSAPSLSMVAKRSDSLVFKCAMKSASQAKILLTGTPSRCPLTPA